MKEHTNVVKLNVAHPSRSRNIQTWHSKQVDQKTIAMINIALTSDYKINSRGIGMEPEIAEAMLEELDLVRGRLLMLLDGLTGECRLGTISEPVILRLSELLSDLMRANPNLFMRLFQSTSGLVVDQILEGKLHGGFVIGEVDEPRITAIPIRPITLRIVAPYEWQERIRSADWVDIAKLPWIVMSPKCSFHKITAEMFKRHKLSPTSLIAIDHETTLRKLVASGVGLSLMREDMALDAEAKQEVVIWPKGAETKQLNFICLQSDERSPLIQALCKSVRAVWN